MQTAQYVFLSCPVFALLWGLIRSWVGISSNFELIFSKESFYDDILVKNSFKNTS
jgi:hypothetical protein